MFGSFGAILSRRSPVFLERSCIASPSIAYAECVSFPGYSFILFHSDLLCVSIMGQWLYDHDHKRRVRRAARNSLNEHFLGPHSINADRGKDTISSWAPYRAKCKGGNRLSIALI